MAVRELPGRAAARDRRQRARQGRVGPALLEPRPDLQRHRGARPGARLDLPAPADRAAAELRRAGLLDLRVGRLPQRGGHVLRRAAGRRGRRAPARRAPAAPAGPGRAHPHPLGRRRERRDRLQAVPARCATSTAAGAGSTSRSRWPALAGPIPLADRFESNDDAGTQATPLRQTRVDFSATLDFWDDNVDVYKVYLRAKQRLVVTLDGPRGVNTDLLLWKPGTQRVQGLSLALLRQRVALSAKPGDRASRSRTARRPQAGTTSRRSSCSPAPARTGSATPSARASSLGRARRGARAPGSRPRRRAAARPSSRPRRRRRTPPRRSRRPGRGPRRRRSARRGGSSGP